MSFIPVLTGKKKKFSLRGLGGLSSWFDPNNGAYQDGAAQFTAGDKARLAIDNASQTGLSPLTGDFSYSFWLNPTTVTDTFVVMKGSNAGATPGYYVYIQSTGVINLGFCDGTGIIQGSSSAGVVTSGSWQNYTAVYNRSGNAYIYKNGNTASPVVTLDISAKTASVTSSSEFSIGAYINGLNYFYNGSMDSLGFWNKALSAAEVTALYNAGAGQIYSDLTATEQTNLVSWYDFSEEGGTRYDSKGTNHLTQTFANIIDNTSSLGTELVTNGAFTTDTTGWTAADATIASVAGGQSGNALEITGTGVGYGGGYTSFATTTNQNYTLSYYFKKGTGTSGSVLIGTTAGSSNIYLITGLTDANWTLKTINFKATSTTTYLYLANTGTTGTSLFDTVSVKALTQTNLNGGFESQGTGETLGSELLSNVGFETAGGGGADVFADWAETAGDGAIANETTLFHGGAHALKITCGASNNTSIYGAITTTALTRYKCTFWSRGDGTRAGKYLIYDNTAPGVIIVQTFTGNATTTYTQTTVYFTTPANCISVSLILYPGSTNGDIAYFDDVSIKAVTASAPFLNWTAATGGSSTITVDSTAPYSGTYSALMTTDAVPSSMSLSQDVLTAGHKYSVSVYAKASAGTPTVFVAGGAGYDAFATTTSYVKYTKYITSTTTTFYIYPGTASSSVFLDDLTILSTEIPAVAGIAAGLSQDGNLCASFNGTSQYLSHADDAKLRVGSSNFTTWGWVNLSSLSTGSKVILAKYLATGNQREWYVNYEGADAAFEFVGSTSGTANDIGISATGTTVVPNVWYFVMAEYDGAKIYLTINNGTASSIAYTSGFFSGTAAFTIGGLVGSSYLPGREDGVGFIKRTLTASEKTALFALGKGVKYAALPSTISADSSLCFWNLDTYSAGTSNIDRLDSTANGMTFTSAGNTPSGQGVDYYEGTVSKWLDQSGNSVNLTQTTQANRLLYVTNAQNGKPVLRGDGLTKSLSNATDLIGTGNRTVVAVIKLRGWGGAGGGRIIDNGAFIFGVYDGLGVIYLNSATNYKSADSSIALGTAYVVAVTRTATTGLANFYINGVLSGTADQTAGAPAAGTPTNIGNNAAGDRGFDGDIDEIAIYNKILPSYQITSLTTYLRRKWGI